MDTMHDALAHFAGLSFGNEKFIKASPKYNATTRNFTMKNTDLFVTISPIVMVLDGDNLWKAQAEFLGVLAPNNGLKPPGLALSGFLGFRGMT
jgi:hypothetical protein